jgi:carboxypeptidase C (cathepsin A)
MYAGTFQVAATQQQNNLFYWLFKNTSLPTNDQTPLVLWLNGGPGASSMFGLFLENGPLKVTKTGPGMDDFSLGLAPQGSWGDQVDILYVDQPAGTGFSYY